MLNHLLNAKWNYLKINRIKCFVRQTGLVKGRKQKHNGCRSKHLYRQQQLKCSKWTQKIQPLKGYPILTPSCHPICIWLSLFRLTQTKCFRGKKHLHIMQLYTGRPKIMLQKLHRCCVHSVWFLKWSCTLGLYGLKIQKASYMEASHKHLGWHECE